MLFTLGACNVREKIDEKISEKITEGVVNKITGGNADIDLDKGNLTIKDDEGQNITFSSSEWPKGKAADLIPKIKKGNLVSVMNTDNLCMIILEEVDKKAYNQFIDDLEDKGFKNDGSNYSDATTISYGASLNEKTLVQVYYGIEDETITITVQIED